MEFAERQPLCPTLARIVGSRDIPVPRGLDFACEELTGVWLLAVFEGDGHAHCKTIPYHWNDLRVQDGVRDFISEIFRRGASHRERHAA